MTLYQNKWSALPMSYVQRHGACEHIAVVLYAVENKDKDLENQQLEETWKYADQYKKEAERMKNDELKRLLEEAKKAKEDALRAINKAR